MDKDKKDEEKPIVALDDADITILKTYVSSFFLRRDGNQGAR